MAIAPIQGLWETHITVRDLEASIRFYREVVGLTLAHRVPDRHAAFFWVGAPRHAMLGLWSIHTSPMAMRLHYAFQVSVQDVEQAVGMLHQAGLQALSGIGEPIEEPQVIPWIPAASVYFRDPDDHSLEFIATLPEPAQPERAWLPLSEWRGLHRSGRSGRAGAEG